MTKTTTIRTCDVCGKELEVWNGASLNLSYTLKDYIGVGYAKGGKDFKDLCDDCAIAIDNAINNLCLERDPIVATA